MQQVSGVRGQHLEDADGEPLRLPKWVQRGQQRDRGTGTRVFKVGGLTERDQLTNSIRG